MGWLCCRIKGCKTSEKVVRSNTSLFKVPADAKTRNEWTKILQLDLKPTHVVCEKHFSPCDVISRAYKEHNGFVV